MHFICLRVCYRKIILDYAKQKNIQITFSIGGAEGSASIKPLSADQLSKEISNILGTYNLNGVDFDIEDPSQFKKISDTTRTYQRI